MKGMEFASNGNRQKVSGNDNLNLQQGNRVCFAKSYGLNGMPTLVVNHKITRALMVQKQCPLRYSLQLTCFLLAVNTWLNRSTNRWTGLFLLSCRIWQVHKTTKRRQNCSFCGHCRLHACWRFIGALVPEALMGFVKLGYFLPLPRCKPLWCKWKSLFIKNSDGHF